MTEIKPNRQLKRETAKYLRHRPIIIELHPAHMQLRLKGKRKALSVDYEAIYNLAAKIAAERIRLERKEKRRGAR